MASRKNNQLNLGLGVDLEQFKKGFADAIKATKGSTAAIEQEAKDMAASIVQSMKKVESASTLKQASRALDNMVGKMHAFGMEGTKAFNEVTKKAGQMKAQLDDVNGLIKASRPDAPFQALHTTLTASAQAFAGVQGAMALFGAESENLQKTLLKVQAAMAFAEGFKALDGLQDGFKQLNMTLLKNPLIAGATVIAAATAAFVTLTSVTQRVYDSQKLLNDVQNEGLKIASKEIGEVSALSAILLDESQSREVRNQALKTLQLEYPGYLQNLSIEKTNINDLKAATDELIKTIIKRASVESALDKLRDVGKKQMGVDMLKADLEKFRTGTDYGGNIVAFNQAIKARQNVIDHYQNELDQQTKDLTNYIAGQDSKIVAAVLGGGTTAPTPKATKKKGQTDIEMLGPAGEFEAFDQSQLKLKGLTTVTAEKTKEDKLSHYALVTLRGGYLELTPTMKAYNDQQMAVIQANREMKITSEALTDVLQNSTAGAIMDLSAAFGEAIATGADMADALGQTFINAMSGFMKAFGQMLIKAGIARMVMDKALIIPGGGPAAIAAGAALIATASGITALMKKGMKAEGFASGGLIPGNSRVGDRLLAPVNSGEVVLNTGQQNELLRIANGKGGNSIPQWRTLFTGREIKIMLDQTNKDYSR